MSRCWPFVALAVLLATLTWPAWTDIGHLVIAGDAAIIHYPYQVLLRDALAAGEFPWWNPYTFGGIPAFATLQSGFGYPPTWLLAWLPPLAAMDWLVGLHVLLAGMGAAWCARQIGASKEGQFLSGLAYSMGSAMVARMLAGHVSFLEANAWLPWATGLAITVPRPRGIVYLALVMTMLTLAGQPEVLIFCLWWLPLWAVFGCFRDGWRAAAFAVLRTVVGVALGIGLSAFQLLPSIALLLNSNRQAGASWDFLTAISLPPWHLLGLIAPQLFGDGKHTYLLGPNYEWHERLFYIGLVPLLAATRAVGRWRRLCWAASVVPVALALGRYAPWYSWATAILPGYGSLRIPSKHLVLAALALCLAAGLGIPRLQGRRVSLTSAALAMVLLVGGMTVALWFPALAAQVGGSEHLAAQGDRDAALAAASGALQQAGVIVLLVAAAAWLPPPWAIRAQLLLASVELLVVLGPFRFQPVNPVAVIDPQLLQGQTRVAVIGDGGAIYGNFGPVLRVRQPVGYVSLFSSGYAALLTGNPNPGVAIDVDSPDNPALTVLGYGVLVERGPGKVTVMLVDPPPQRLWVARCSQPGDALSVREPDFPRDVCITRAGAASTEVNGPPGAAEVTDERMDGLSIRAEGPGWLVTSEPWYPGWSASESGVPVPIEVVDGALVGVPLADGPHTIDLRYTPGWLQQGVLLSLLSGILLLGVWLLPRRIGPIRARLVVPIKAVGLLFPAVRGRVFRASTMEPNPLTATDVRVL